MQANNKFIVITSIYPPSSAIEAFSKWPGWTTVVVGDRKSPAEWCCPNVVYLSLEDQLKQFPDFAPLIPENTYIRKSIGYLYAIQNGAETIFESDDDNIPYRDARECIEQALRGSQRDGTELQAKSGWVNVYAQFGAVNCWPRGYPLELILDRTSPQKNESGPRSMPWRVLQYLADDDPDVDAIYRMTQEGSVHFARGRSFRLTEGTYCPFNSQATLWHKDAFPLLFLPIGKTDRVTDILRGYIALACLWKHECTLGYSSPVVYQERNFHNLLKDFEQESELYLHCSTWTQMLLDVKKGTSLQETYANALEMLIGAEILPTINLDAYRVFTQYFCAKPTGVAENTNNK